jgi:sugar fermentation stimulation protein A
LVAIEVRYTGTPRAVVFLDRPNRYLAWVRGRAGAPFEAHVPNPGRMGELLRPGVSSGWAIPAAGPNRRTGFDLVSVRHRGGLVSIDSRIANRLVARALAEGAWPEMGPGPWKAEVPYGSSRIDFGQAESDHCTALLEVKSSNLRLGPYASFPDAPTLRGARHLRELARAARRGVRASVLFAIQREDVSAFRPNEALDPEFARSLRAAARAGVVLSARTLRVRPGGVGWGRAVPVELAGAPSERPEST